MSYDLGEQDFFQKLLTDLRQEFPDLKIRAFEPWDMPYLVLQASNRERGIELELSLEAIKANLLSYTNFIRKAFGRLV